MLKDLLESKKCFKLVLGAGNEDIKHIEKLVKLYYEAGCRFFDLSMNEEAAKIAKRVCPDGLFCFSSGIKDDPHTMKAKINNQVCKKCSDCSNVCVQNAIYEFSIDEKKCIGCLNCKKICKFNAIETYSKVKNIKEVLPEILKYNPDCIELHACSDDENEIEENWNYINEAYDGFISLCIDRSRFGDIKLISKIKELLKQRDPYTTIIQADGNPMSGGEDDYKTTLQAVAAAELIGKEHLPVYILVSGGTNSKTKELLNLCSVDINGISIGSYARKIVKEYVEREDFLQNEKIFNEALQIAKNLVNTVN